MKKVYLQILIFAFYPSILFAIDVSPEKAALVATNFCLEKRTEKVSVTQITPRFINGGLVYYWIDLSNSAYIVISGESEAYPILAYSSSAINQMNVPPACQAWLDHYANQILYIREHQLKADQATRDLWEKYSDEPFITEEYCKSKGVEPLTHSNWGQGAYYNYMCPEDPEGPGGHAISGCVAIAMAQVLYYYRYPESGEGSLGYNSNYGYEFVDFENTNYMWEEMVNQIHQMANPEIAELVYHVGVSVEMNYGPGSSGALTQDAADALRDYFMYDESIQYISFFDLGDAFYDSVMYNIDQNLVVLYRGGDLGSSHSFVCDGYQDSSFFHFNWGWNGGYNGYFYVDNLHPGYYDFTFNQGAVINIYPRENYPEYCQGNITLAANRGTFTDGSGPENYQDNQSCSWIISPEDPEISGIQLSFTAFNTTVGDVVTVYDGPSTEYPVLGQFTGDELPPLLVSSGNEMLVVFESDEENSAQGWQTDYLAYSGPFCNENNVLQHFSYHWFRDGSGPYHYIDLTDCCWLIDPQGEEWDSISSVNLYFREITLSSGDSIFVYDGEDDFAPLLGKYHGNELPDTIFSSGNKLYVNFVSNESDPGVGWVAGYTAQLPVYCNDTAMCLDQSAIIEDGSGDKKYVPNSDCHWIIDVEDASSIRFEFLEFDLEHGYDQLKFYDFSNDQPTLYSVFWGHEVPEDFEMNTNKILVSFFSDLSVEYEGWTFVYTAFSQGLVENSQGSLINIHPNPASEILQIDFKSKEHRLVNFDLRDINISLMDQGLLNFTNTSSCQLDVSAYPAGVYFLRFHSSGLDVIRKLVIF